MGSLYDKIKTSSVPSTSVSPTLIPRGSLYSKIQQMVSKQITPEVLEIPEVPVAVQKFPGTLETLTELQVDPLSLKGGLDLLSVNPLKANKKVLEIVKSSWETLKAPFIEATKDIKDLFTTATTRPKIIGKELEIAADIGGIVFSPISALFEGANQIPILGSISKLISLPFIAIGEGGANLADFVVDKLPIEDETKESIREGTREIFALAGQLALGKITHIADKKVKELKTRFGEKDAQTIIEQSNKLAEQAKEPIPITPDGQPLSAAEIRQLSESKMTTGEFQQFMEARAKGEVPPIIEPEVKVKPKREVIELPREQLPVRPVEVGIAEKGVSGLEARMKGIVNDQNVKLAKEEAAAKGLDISIYDKINKAEQLRESAKYVERTSQKEVLEVLKGEKPTPKGLLTNAVMLALEQKSLREKNVDLAIKLASLRSTRMGQEISILTEVKGTSPVSGMDAIIRARADRAKRTLKPGETLETKKKQAMSEAEKAEKSIRLKFDEANKLLNEIVCK